jgi:L,D-peptidoglycan transpeptidase YkuD (ErfK/YbiS/YcfS/YnhG family)
MALPPLDRILVRPAIGPAHHGLLVAGASVFRCALGRSGLTANKREGDGGTPIGLYPALQAFWRADRLRRPETLLPLAALKPDDGWCEVPADRNYNRPVELPYPASTESMFRDDNLYDVVLDLAWNRDPIRKGRGSAIFLHLARAGYGPTQGCIALALPDILKLLPRVGPGTLFDVRRH